MHLYSYYANGVEHRDKIENWQVIPLLPDLYYSSRSTVYTHDTYPSNMHFHDYFELLFFAEGDVRYSCEGISHRMRPGDVILIPPGKLHVSILESESTRYVRHVFYLTPGALDMINGRAVLRFLEQEKGFFFSLTEEQQPRVNRLLQRMDEQLSGDSPAGPTIALALALELLNLLNTPSEQVPEDVSGPSPQLAAIQQYIDANFTVISSVSDVAEHFFYSREYVSRLFRKGLNTTVSDYILTRRVSYCRELLQQDIPLLELCYKAGFGSVSAFTRSFRQVTGMTPASYRRLLRKE